MKPRTRNQWIIAAIWTVARAGLILCFVVDVLARLDRMPRTRQAARRGSWYVCVYVVKMHAAQRRYIERVNAK